MAGCLMLRFGVVGVSLVAVALVLEGCVGSTSRLRQERTESRTASPVVSPLTVVVTYPDKLSSINSLAVARPTFARDSVEKTLAQDVVQSIVESVSDQVLSLKVLTAASSAANVGGESAADAVLLMELQTYRDRAGSALGGEPATVAFMMTIKARATGIELWRAQYFYQQEALSDNWLKLGDRLGAHGTGAGWASGRQVLERGIEEAIADFGRRRESQFLAPNAQR